MLSPAELGRLVVDEARALGFHRVGLVPASDSPAQALYEAWLAAGHHGEMAYLAEPEHVLGRQHPRSILPTARTLVVVALSYARADAPVPLGGGPRGHIARYARGADYHHVFKQKLDALAARLREHVPGLLARACVDTAPLLERDAAERAGLGFVAKNTMLIAPGLGSYVLLGELLLDAEAHLESEPGRKRCGSCRACLDACPTGAFVEAGVLDARRCISYLTIELTGSIPRDLRALVGKHVFGCDICQEVCPFNAAEREGATPELSPMAGRCEPDLLELVTLGQNQYRQYVKQSAMRRIHRPQLLRNVCVALGNSGDARAVPPLRLRLADRHALVREHAAWALGRLGDADGLRARLLVELDLRVREELELSLLDLLAPSA